MKQVSTTCIPRFVDVHVRTAERVWNILPIQHIITHKYSAEQETTCRTHPILFQTSPVDVVVDLETCPYIGQGSDVGEEGDREDDCKRDHGGGWVVAQPADLLVAW